MGAAMPQHRRRQFLKHGTLPQMAAFEAIVRLGSFARAAQEMHMAQPTVSGLVRKLADSAGAPLFEKVGRRAVPTAAGRALFETAGEVFAKLERAGMEIAALFATPSRLASASAMLLQYASVMRLTPNAIETMTPVVRTPNRSMSLPPGVMRNPLRMEPMA